MDGLLVVVGNAIVGGLGDAWRELSHVGLGLVVVGDEGEALRLSTRRQDGLDGFAAKAVIGKITGAHVAVCPVVGGEDGLAVGAFHLPREVLVQHPWIEAAAPLVDVGAADGASLLLGVRLVADDHQAGAGDSWPWNHIENLLVGEPLEMRVALAPVAADVLLVLLVVKQGTTAFHALLIGGVHRPDPRQNDAAVFARRIDVRPRDDLHVHLQMAAFTVEDELLDTCRLRREVEALVAVLVPSCKELKRLLRIGDIQRACPFLLCDADAETLPRKDPHRLVQHFQFGCHHDGV